MGFQARLRATTLLRRSMTKSNKISASIAPSNTARKGKVDTCNLCRERRMSIPRLAAVRRIAQETPPEPFFEPRLNNSRRRFLDGSLLLSTRVRATGH